MRQPHNFFTFMIFSVAYFFRLAIIETEMQERRIFVKEQLVKETMERIMESGRSMIPQGNVATYIPELGKARKDALGLCIALPDGTLYKAGDTNIRFTIQSISKVISLCKALELHGAEEVFSHVGMEPSGEAFNSIVELDLQSNRPFNPMINSGAIAVESTIIDYVPFEEMLDYTRKLCDDPGITLNRQVYLSEMNACDRNRAIAYLLKSKGIITTNVDNSIELYTKMCSLNVTAESLANFALLLANGGVWPETEERLLAEDTVRTVLSIMLTCGMYDGSGRFAVEVGIPTKSGVGGGLMAPVYSKCGIGIFGPSLDKKGNCIAGCEMMKHLSRELGLHMF